MDRQVRKRLQQDITIYPCTGVEDGDRMFGEPFVVKGYSVPKYKVVITRAGEEIQVHTAIIVDGSNVGTITDLDEVQTPYIQRTPVKYIAPYQSLRPGTELVELYI